MPGETAERAGGRGAENGRSFNQALYPVYALSPALMPRATSADASRRARAWKSRYVMRRSSWITATRSGWTAAVPGGQEPSLPRSDHAGEHVDRDGLHDLICHFRIVGGAFQLGDIEGILRGRTLSETPFVGRDSVRIVPIHHSKDDEKDGDERSESSTRDSNERGRP